MRFTTIFFLSLFINSLSGQTNWMIDKNGCKFYSPDAYKRESVLWTGDCVDSLANGKGKLIYYLFGFKTKKIFDGTLINGKPEGYGKFVLYNGTILQGRFKDGDFYEGTRTEKSRKDTYIYTGKFKDNEINGIGKLVVTDSHVFKGKFEDGLPTEGIEKYRNGDYFEGKYKNGYYSDGKFVSEIDDFIIESDNWKYFTALTGKLTIHDTIIYIGELDYTIPSGQGKLVLPNGDCYEGAFKKGTPNGKGILRFSDGLIYKAKWKKGKIEGKGEIIYPNGEKTIGKWKNNELIYEKTAPYSGE